MNTNKFIRYGVAPSGVKFNSGSGNIGFRFDVNKNNTTHKFYDFSIVGGTEASEYEPYTYNDITIYINEPLREGDILKAENRKILVERHRGERDYLEGDYDNCITDGIKTVYPLAEPVIEEVETDYTRLMLESYENATVYFNSHIFPTSTIRYQANVISTSEIMSVNDEQDMLLIDSATEIAVIKLTM